MLDIFGHNIANAIFDIAICMNEDSVRARLLESNDAFMLQARGKDSDDGNATYVGKWVKTPRVARTLNCLKYRRSAIVDVGNKICRILYIMYFQIQIYLQK